MAISLKWPASQAGWEGFLSTTGLTPQVGIRALLLAWYAPQFLGVQIEISSAYRSEAHQDELRARWDAGNRSGLTVRPAEKSLHSEGRAFDIAWVGPEPSKATREGVGSLGEVIGLRWGGRFQTPDPTHFDF